MSKKESERGEGETRVLDKCTPVPGSRMPLFLFLFPFFSQSSLPERSFRPLPLQRRWWPVSFRWSSARLVSGLLWAWAAIVIKKLGGCTEDADVCQTLTLFLSLLYVRVSPYSFVLLALSLLFSLSPYTHAPQSSLPTLSPYYFLLTFSLTPT